MRKVKLIAVITAALMLSGVFCTSAFAFGDALSALGEYFGGGGNTGNSNSGNLDDNDEPSSNGDAQVNFDSGIVDILQGILGSEANTLTNSQITDILNNFDVNDLLGGDSDVLNEVMELIGANSPTDSDNSGNSGSNGNSGYSQTIYTTAPQYNTNVYVTEADTTAYSYSGSSGGNSQSSSTPSRANVAETPAENYSSIGSASAETTTVLAETTTGAGETTTLASPAVQISTTLNDRSAETVKSHTKTDLSVKMVIGIVILLIFGITIILLTPEFNDRKRDKSPQPE